MSSVEREFWLESVWNHYGWCLLWSWLRSWRGPTSYLSLRSRFKDRCYIQGMTQIYPVWTKRTRETNEQGKQIFPESEKISEFRRECSGWKPHRRPTLWINSLNLSQSKERVTNRDHFARECQRVWTPSGREQVRKKPSPLKRNSWTLRGPEPVKLTPCHFPINNIFGSKSLAGQSPSLKKVVRIFSSWK